MKILKILFICLLANFSFEQSVNRLFSNALFVNPNATLTVPQLINQSGYPIEIHHVTTEDGYILELHRIPYGVKSGAGDYKPAVLVFHGLLSSSADWIITGPERALGYILADAGYDVWLANARGNTYSRKHIKLDPNKRKFWDFSWHEIGIFDIPATVDYIRVVTMQAKITYIGHSQGTTSFYVMGSQKPEYNNKIKAMFSLAPAVYMKNAKSPLLMILAPFEKEYNVLASLIGNHELLPTKNFTSIVAAEFCKDGSLTVSVCENILFQISGYDEQEMDPAVLSLIFSHYPAGSSTKQLRHFLQLYNSGEFRLYDYGPVKNMIKYKQVKPPKYDLSKIVAPVSLHYSLNDWFVPPDGVFQAALELGNLSGKYLVPYKNFTHTDFQWATHAKTLVYDLVIQLMQKNDC